MAQSASLSLVIPIIKSDTFRSSTDSASSASLSPRSPRHEAITSHSGTPYAHDVPGLVKNYNTGPQPSQVLPTSPTLTSLPQFPSSPKRALKQGREQSRSFFSNLKASKSSSRVHQGEPTIRKVSEEAARSRPDHKANNIYSMRKAPGSTPDLSMSTFETNSVALTNEPTQQERAVPRRPVGAPAMSDSSLPTHPSNPPGKKIKPKLGFLRRSGSTRLDGGGRGSKPSTPIRTEGLEDVNVVNESVEAGLRTAPLQNEKDHPFREMMNSSHRNRSADRQPRTNADHGNTQGSRVVKDQSHKLVASTSGLFGKDHGIGKAGKNFLNKIGRSGSSNAREVVEDENYVFSIINLPLVEQTRITRIAKRLEDSKDKTEFWMPALPWRCIDYLNFRGCEEEGLYRVSGSAPRIKEWQRRFDREGDINLFNESDLYDINIIGSMFKAWLRDLPCEIFPKAIQNRIAQQCSGAKEVPQMLKDELSSLPPWNYYLLFAITCHLSLLHAYVDKNRMNYSNLCICFQPCLKVDTFCFQFLVCDWRNCWQGCWTEKQALEEEYRILDGFPSRGGGSSSGSTAVEEERSVPSSDSTKAGMTGRTQDRPRPPPLALTAASDEHLATPTRNGNANARLESNSHLPELAPVIPMSPIAL